LIRRRALLGLALLPCPALAAPKSEPWPMWEAHDPASRQVVDHAPWGRLLARFRREGADGIARLAYGAAVAERAALEADIARLAALPIRRFNRAEQFAYWVNLYNMVTVAVVLKHYPVASIRDIGISPGWFSRGPWGAKLVTVEGTALSLDDIEHRILRPGWRDARVHYVVNCASLGCPDLPAEPLTAANAEAMLEAGARRFVNHPRGAAVEGERLVVSSLYVWFAEDFGPRREDVVRHLRRFARPELDRQLAAFREADGDRYDWGLNEAK
jgi:hypothetical protein